MQRIYLFVFLFFVCSCGNRNKPIAIKEPKNKPVILLQPLSFNDSPTLVFLKDSIEQFYPVTIEIAKLQQFPPHCYYKPRNRYRADSAIKWLKQGKPVSVRAIVGITKEDVSTTKSGQVDFGVMGLGYKPGDACIISTYRLKKTANSPQHLRERLFKVVVHEMGHNFSLNHCPDQQCIMVDAEAKMKLDGVKGLCTSCKQKLQL
ncbi:hypothetical protein ESA94_10095 [Lacibacter luteus]|uniref:Zn-dependent protease n=1 Tax=Lacibacter luteus TaxID=2508719 RepID=A0A4Q1CKD2_9BACT|nr:zinc-dependent metalloprotease family protein [Lacibacter luteus]RXK60802.1 hypothetical protein ESA94_10095 [Lacibacter luteus]